MKLRNSCEENQTEKNKKNKKCKRKEMPFDKDSMMELLLPPTPPMDLSDSSSNSSNDYKVSFTARHEAEKSVHESVSNMQQEQREKNEFV